MKSNIKYILIGGIIGNFIEWYNFLLYGFLAPIISLLFFPLQNKTIALLFTYSIFAVSFLARPLGGLFIGYLGDTYGRQRALIISLIMMLIPALLIGLLPTYQSIGLASPILLCLLRILQGFSTGGEHTGSAIYVYEHAPTTYKSFWITTIPAIVALGIFMSSATAWIILHLFKRTVLLAWGWRIGFWLGALFCIVGILLRLKLPETPAFQQMKKQLKKPIPLSLIFSEKYLLKNMLILLLLSSCWGIIYQILYVWMPTYLSHYQFLTNSKSLAINNSYLLLFSLCILLAGYLADKTNRLPLLFIACSLLIISAYPLFTWLSSHNLTKINCAMLILSVIFSVYIAASFTIMVTLFQVEIRYTTFSLGFNLGLAIFGGSCPLIVTWLIHLTNNNKAPAYYIISAATMGFLACLLLINKQSLQKK
ncbi:MAG: hypothetical protein A3E87_07520 [Gammaproteobacteria bacterium RIFCSPHIGHO2_12_FULL_35_23]|nr:MAG: hypothetical protein A3E87_07520 [Gammaproteobacteria bacterium RIFCSPHIGHO2_12_FULL_35_23]